MAAIDSSTQSLCFLPQYWEYRHIARHTVTTRSIPTLLCRQSETKSPTYHGWTSDGDGLEVSF